MIALRALTVRARRSDFVRHGLLVFVGMMSANGLLFVFYSFVSRALGVEQYGILISLMSAVLLVAVGPATVGATIVARLAADLRAVDDRARLRRLGDVVTSSTALAGVVAFIVVGLLAGPIARYLHLTTTIPVVLTGAALGLAFALPVQRGLFQGTEAFGLFAVSLFIEAAARVVAGPLLAARYGTDGALIGLCVGSFLSWAYNVVRLRRFGAEAVRLRLPFRHIFATSANVSLAVLSINVLLFYDVIFVRHYFSSLTAGLYGAAALVGRAVYTIIGFLPTIVLPKASARSHSGHRTGSLLTMALGTGGAVVAAALLATAFAPRLIVVLLAGRAFAAADGFVLAYTFALGALAMANVVAMYKIGLQRFGFVVPLVGVALAEIAAVTIWHATIGNVLLILCLGHALSLAAVFTGLPDRRLKSASAGPAATAPGDSPFSSTREGVS